MHSPLSAASPGAAGWALPGQAPRRGVRPPPQARSRLATLRSRQVASRTPGRPGRDGRPPVVGQLASITPGSIDGFGAAQLVGGALAYGLVRLLYPEAAAVATQITAEPPAPRLAEERT